MPDTKGRLRRDNIIQILKDIGPVNSNLIKKTIITDKDNKTI